MTGAAPDQSSPQSFRKPSQPEPVATFRRKQSWRKPVSQPAGRRDIARPWRLNGRRFFDERGDRTGWQRAFGLSEHVLAHTAEHRSEFAIGAFNRRVPSDLFTDRGADGTWRHNNGLDSCISEFNAQAARQGFDAVLGGGVSGGKGKGVDAGERPDENNAAARTQQQRKTSTRDGEWGDEVEFDCGAK